MTRLIKRYGNRKLYDTHDSRYVTLDDISRLVKGGEDVRVVDNDSSEDLTAVTFAQIILEEERKRSGFLPVPILRNMIRQGEAAIQDFAERVDKSMEAIGSLSERAGKKVEEMVGRSTESGRALLEELRNAPQKRIEALQKQIDEGLKRSVERIRAVPGLQKEVERVERSIRKLEEQLARFRRGEDPHDEDNPGSSDK